MAALTGTKFFLRGRGGKKKCRTTRSRKPQTHRYERKFERGSSQRECQVPVTPFIQGTGRERTPDSLEEFPLSCLLTLFLYTAVIPPGSTVIKIGQSNWLPLKGLLRKHIGTHTHRHTHSWCCYFGYSFQRLS